MLEEEQPRLQVRLGELGGGLKGTRDEAVEQAKQLALLEERLQEEKKVRQVKEAPAEQQEQKLQQDEQGTAQRR